MRFFKYKNVWLLYILIIGLIFSCSTNRYCNQIVEHIEINCLEDTKNCEIDLKEVFPFNWDTLYIFKGYDDPLFISKVIGFDCECTIVPEHEKMYLFVKNEQIIQKKTLNCYEVQFIEMNNDEGTIQIGFNQTIFKVKKSERGDENHYALSPKL